MSATGTLITVGTIAGIYALLALALNIKFGETGILDFGHVAFFLVGAYAAALFVQAPPEVYDFQEFLFGLDLQTRVIEFTGYELTSGLAWLVAIAVAIAAAAFLGLVVALPAIRLRADYLAIALLGVSVIAVRTVQTETWLVNGPDALRGYSRPFSELVPLPASSAEPSILLGLVVMLVWVMLLYLIVRIDLIEELQGRARTLVDRGLWVSTFGVGYWAARRTRARIRAKEADGVIRGVTPADYAPVVAAPLAFALVATAMSMAGLGSEAILVFLGVGSLVVWFVAGLKIREHYRAYNRQSALAGLVVAVGFLVALIPVSLVGDLEGPIAFGGALLTIVLLGAYGYGLVRGLEAWDRLDIPGQFVGIGGIALLWLLAFRYFGKPILDAGSIASMVRSTQENIFWLVDFDATLGPSLDYRRFFFIIVISIVMLSYFMLESLRSSPYGRVLRAIRDDENVAMSLGKNTFYYKVQAMVIGGAFAGLAGALGAVYYRSLGYTLFNPIVTFFIFLAVILGGRGNNKGVILGAAMYWMLVRGTSEFAAMFPSVLETRIIILRNAIIGLLLVLLLYYRPEGIWPEERTIREVKLS